ncbi:MAG: nucleoside-diphosphate kinase [Nanoarchaeota archaeon]|nr:nucleoside-diphosphate kinase [Nanoarchaeota archaeon]
MERTFLLIKPDGVTRGLVGDILSRFEKAELRIVGMKLLVPTADLIRKHYPSSDEWLGTAGNKTLRDYEKNRIDPKKELGTNDPIKIGKMIKEWLITYLTSGPVVAMVLEGNHAIENVRRLVGPTLPILAGPGTIRGDYSCESPDLSNKERRPVKNLVHASGDASEAKNEIALWFKKHELL